MILIDVLKSDTPPSIELVWSTGERELRHGYPNSAMAQLRAALGDQAAPYEVLIAEVEATYQKPSPEEIAATERAAIQGQIDALERQHLMPRIARETFIFQAEERALEMGLTLEYLRAKNKGYAGLKALDEQIAALRALI